MSTIDLQLPTKINFNEEEKGKRGVVEIEPCYPGYGITLGNALRRVLLSSLPGAAVSAVKIKGAQHEFMPVTNVKEDVLEIVLNLKQLRLKVFSDEPVKLEIKHKGEKKITAKDIKENSDVEIINKDLHIATLTDDKAELDMEIYVQQGRGYVPTEARDEEKLDTDTIAIDALYSPVKNVGIRIENVRVGQMTNFDKLILDIETDGTLSFEDAFKQATELLINHFNFLLKGEEPEAEDGKAEELAAAEEAANLSEEGSSIDSGLSEEAVATEDEEKEPEKDETEEKVEEPEKPAPKKRGRPKKVKEE